MFVKHSKLQIALLGAFLSASIAFPLLAQGDHRHSLKKPKAFKEAGEAYPVYVINDAKGHLLVVEHSRNQVLRLTASKKPTVVAGNGSSDYSGDGGVATKAGLFLMGIALDDAGNLYIADHNHHRIRKVSVDGKIATIAGTGKEGFSGDGGPALQAQVNDPAGIAVDKTGNVYIADTYNNRIRKITPDGMIDTIAGDGIEGHFGDGGFAKRARLNFPWGISVTPDNRILIADMGNNRIRIIDQSGIIYTIAGTGRENFTGDGGRAVIAGLAHPQLAVADSKGNIFVADTNNNRIRKIDGKGMITTVVGDGLDGGKGDGGDALKASLSGPYGLSIDLEGNLYIADTGNGRVRRVRKDGRIESLAL